jgi:predicted phage terminase large subunit-like protein
MANPSTISMAMANSSKPMDSHSTTNTDNLKCQEAQHQSCRMPLSPAKSVTPQARTEVKSETQFNERFEKSSKNQECSNRSSLPQSSMPEKIPDGSQKFETRSKENPSSASSSHKMIPKSKSKTFSFGGSSWNYSLEQLLDSMTPQEQALLASTRNQEIFEREQRSLRDLASFSKRAWQELEPGTPIIWNWHLELICEYLTLVRSRSIRRLILNVPPQTGKSRFVNVFYPVWSWATNPERRLLSSSYSGDLSESFNRDRSRLIQSDWFQEMFPGKVSLIRDTHGELENSVGGKMTATSTGGTATGKGAHDIIVDDPVNPQQAASELELAGANSFFDETLRTRLSDQVNGSIVIVMQRLGVEDLTGHILSKEADKWKHVRLTMECEEDETIIFPISGRKIHRKAGDLLFAEKFPRDVIETNMKIGMGSYVWAGQYQQRPTPRGGAIIKKHWLRYWNSSTLPEQFDEIIQSWDLSFAKAEGSSSVSGTVWGRKGARKILLDEVCARMEYTEARQAIRIMSLKWPTSYVKLVENKANGPAVISDLRSEISGLIPIEPEGDKPARMMAVSPEFESGSVEIPDASMPGYSWSRQYEEEILHFPQKPNDRGDSTSQALRRFQLGSSNIADYYSQLAAEQRAKEKAA